MIFRLMPDFLQQPHYLYNRKDLVPTTQRIYQGSSYLYKFGCHEKLSNQ